MLDRQLKRLRYNCQHLSVFAISLTINFYKIEETSEEKHSLTKKLVGGKGDVKKKGTRFWEKKNETKILYLACVNVTEP